MILKRGRGKQGARPLHGCIISCRGRVDEATEIQTTGPWFESQAGRTALGQGMSSIAKSL